MADRAAATGERAQDATRAISSRVGRHSRAGWPGGPVGQPAAPARRRCPERDRGRLGLTADEGPSAQQSAQLRGSDGGAGSTDLVLPAPPVYTASFASATRAVTRKSPVRRREYNSILHPCSGSEAGAA